jgi:uncharacterized tellurite resistance protein B-like protein
MLSPQAALVYTMVIVAEADHHVADEEITAISDLVGQLPVFEGIGREEVAEMAMTCSEMIAEPDGLDRAFAMIRNALTPPLREAAYALGCEVIAVDRRVNSREIEVLETVRERLGVERAVADLLEAAGRGGFQAA